MTALGPELIPEAEVVVAEALPTLGMLAALLFILGCIHVIDGFVRALFGTLEGAVGWIPFAGKVIRAPIHRIEQKVTNTLGSAERYFDAKMGASFHKLARIGAKLGHEFAALGQQIWTITKFLAMHPTWRELRHFATALLHPLRTAQHVQRYLLRGVRAQVAALRHMVIHGVFPRIGALERELDHVLEHDVAALRARTKAIEHDLAKVFKWIRTHPEALATAAFTGAVAVALRRLGLGWLRCRNVRRLGKAACGLPVGLIEDVLGLALAFLVVVDPVVIAKAAVKSEDVMHDLVVRIAELNPGADDATQEALAGLASGL